MKNSQSRSAVWSVINWAEVRKEVYEEIAIYPTQESTATAISNIESEFEEMELFQKDASELETLLVDEIISILKVENKKEIKRKMLLRKRKKQEKKLREKERKKMKSRVQILGAEDLKDLDPEMMEEISKGIFDKLMGKKKKDKDEDEDDEPNASFYL